MKDLAKRRFEKRKVLVKLGSNLVFIIFVVVVIIIIVIILINLRFGFLALVVLFGHFVRLVRFPAMKYEAIN